MKKRLRKSLPIKSHTKRFGLKIHMPPRPQITRAEYPHFSTLPTRWMDNDIYGHINNALYYAFFDTAINQYLIAEGGLDISMRRL